MERGETLVGGPCTDLVWELLQKRQLGMIEDINGFIREVCAEAERTSTDPEKPRTAIIREMTLNRHSQLWYDACRANGTLRQRRAFQELEIYLRRTLIKRYPEDPLLVEQSVAVALGQIWRKLDQVKKPGWFPLWATQIAVREVIARFREMRRLVEAHDEEAEEEAARLEAVVLAVQLRGGRGDEGGIWQEWRDRIAHAIRYCLPERQTLQELSIGLILDGWEIKELVERLGHSASVLRKYKERALSVLYGCDALITVLEDLLDAFENG